MQLNLNNIEWLVGSEETLNEKPVVPFDEQVIEELDALSKALMKDPMSRQYPDVVTFAFFCRRGNLLKLKDQYSSANIRLGRGMIFHIAPSNVPVNFAYSVVAGLLAGNTNVVRVSQKQFPQVDIIVKHMREIGMHRVAVVRYPHESNANEVFSADCAVRVIWGGDATIARIRECALPARAFDICFADRYSIAAIRPKAILDATEDELIKISERFYNDTYLFDQNACSAPHLVCWKIENGIFEAKKRFWDIFHAYVNKHYELQELFGVNKLAALCRQAVAMDIRQNNMPDNNLVCVQLRTLPRNIEEYRCTSGYFSEYDVTSLDDIAPIITEKYQTLAYFGFEYDELRDFVLRNRLTGIDRIVPFGETTTFSLTWDGMNLIERMSRIISVI